MKFNFKTLCAAGALLCVGNVYAGDTALIDTNPFAKKSDMVSMTWEKFQNTAVEDLPENIIMKSEDVLIDDTNIDRLIKFADRITLKNCDLVSYMDTEPAEKLRTFFSKVFPKSSGINYLSFGCDNVTSILEKTKKLSHLSMFGVMGATS